MFLLPPSLGVSLEQQLLLAPASCRHIYHGLVSVSGAQVLVNSPPPFSQGCQRLPAEVDLWAPSSPLAWFLPSCIFSIAIIWSQILSVLNPWRSSIFWLDPDYCGERNVLVQWDLFSQ